MDIFWILLILAGIIISIFVKWISDSPKDFSELIESELRKNGMQLIRLTYPGLFKVGPFKKIEISVGKPQINNGTVQYEKTYYRIVELKTKNNRKEQVWAKIETGWFKDTEVEFKPKLSEINK